jgi:hypothetical protein
MVLNDTIGDQDFVLVGDPDSRTVRAYETGGITFAAHGEMPKHWSGRTMNGGSPKRL